MIKGHLVGGMYQTDLLDEGKEKAWMTVLPVCVGTEKATERFCLTVSTPGPGFGLSKSRAKELVEVLTGWIERDELPDAPAKLV